MTFRKRWNNTSPTADKDQLARFVKTLYSSGVIAARDEALRDGAEAVLRDVRLLGLPTEEVSPAEVRRVARLAVTLLRKRQTEAP